MRTPMLLAALVAVVAPLTAHAAQAAAQTPITLNGTVASATATSVVVVTPTGKKTVSFGPKMRFFGIGKSSLDKVTTGSFIGTAVTPQPNGTFTSTEVHIFAPALRGTGEGWSKMDKQGKHMMANSTVKSVEQPANMMANSTVRTVGSSAAGKTISLVFPSGKKAITIPSGTPIVAIDPGTVAMLVPGAHVSLSVTPGKAGLVAKRLLVGEHGFVVPM